MKVINSGGVMLHVRDDGPRDGPVVVFSNSLGTDLRLWDPIMPLLTSGLRVIRYDKRGHGLSGVPNGPFVMEDLADDAAAVMDALGVAGAVFVGLSIGGMTAQVLAAKRPDLVKAAVLSNTGSKMGDAQMWAERISVVRTRGIEAMADAVMERWFSEAFRATDALALWRNMLTRTTAEGYAGCCEAIAAADLTQSTAKLDLPVLGIGGAVDGASPPQVVRAVTELAGGRYTQIEGVGHLPCVEAPEEYAGLVNAFLQEIGHV